MIYIPDTGSDFFPSRIRIKYFGILTQKIGFYALEIYDPGCSSRIRILFSYPSRIPGLKRHRIPDPGVKKASDPGSGSATLQSTFQKINA
jgi:hypothetical protein